MPTCSNCATENPDIARFCLACGSALTAPEPEEEERKIVTALFTDIVGSTARAETLDPEDVRAMLAPYYARLRGELERFGGTVEKFIGDAVVALFGAPVAHEDDPERAVRAALAIRSAVAALNEEQEWLDLHIRTAVHTGEALVVVGARTTEGEGMAAGDVMNTAARLQGAAPVDGVAVGELTYRATSHLFEYEIAEPIQAKGKSEPVPVWIVLGEKAAPKRPEPWHRLAGRDEEMEHLTDAWTSAAEGKPWLVTLLGPPGIGKSRLLVELSHRVGPEVPVHWGRCLSYGEGITYWPVTEIVKDAAGVLSDDGPTDVGRKLGALLEALPTNDRDELRTIAAALSNLLGAANTPEGTYSAEEIGQAELHWGIRRFVELRAVEGPLLLVFEDLHWAEPTLVELITSLLQADGPLLVVATARPELAQASPEFLAVSARRSVVELEPLGEKASLQLLDELVGSLGWNASRFTRLLEKAGGNPLFLEETVRMLLDGNLLSGDGDIDSIPIPSSLQALIGSRLDALPTAEKRAAQQASVVGAEFWLGAVEHLAGTDDDLDQRVDALERRDFVYAVPESSIAGEREFAFKHILIRDVAYERLPKGRRAELHVRFSEWISGVGGSESEFVEILAYHLEQACRLAREVQRSPVPPPVYEAAAALTRAGEKAERRGGMREADRYYARALELLDEGSATALDLRVRRAFTRNVLGHVREAIADLNVAAADAVSAGRPDLRATALARLGQIELRRGRVGEARAHLTEAFDIAATLGDEPLQVTVMYRLSALWGDYEGDFVRALDTARAGIEIAEQVDDRALQIEGHLRLGFFLENLGELERAQEALERCLELCRETGSRRDDAQATYLLGLVRYYRGDPDEAERLGLQARDLLERTGETFMGIQNLIALATYALAKDDVDGAERALLEALPPALEGGGFLVVQIYRHLVEVHVRQGRLDDARELLEFARRDAPEEDAYALTQVHLAEATLAAGLGDASSAARAYDEALRLLEEQKLVVELAEARLELARALHRFADVAAARTELGRARESFAAMAAVAHVAEIDGLLNALDEKGAGVPGPLSAS